MLHHQAAKEGIIVQTAAIVTKASYMKQDDSSQKPHALTIANIGVIARVGFHQVEQSHLPDLGHEELLFRKGPRCNNPVR